ncbi:MAG: RNA polymerase sigma factor, partial [Chthoniobacterales bacterium]
RGLFRAWLFGIAAQQARSMFRKKTAAKRGLTLLVPMGGSFERADDKATSPADALAVLERTRILHRAIDELPDDDRDLVHLHYFAELTFAEIALARNMNPKTVCTRLTRCKVKLLNLLEKSNLTTVDG